MATSQNTPPSTASEPPSSSPAAFVGVAAAALVALLVVSVPGPEALPAEGQRMAAIFAVVLILWTTEAVPVGVTSLLAVVLLPIFGVADLPTAFANFIIVITNNNTKTVNNFFIISFYATLARILSECHLIVPGLHVIV